MIFVFADFHFDAERLDLKRGGQVVEADTMVLRVLALLLGSAGHLVSKADLVQEVWEGRAVADNVISVTMARLRQVLGDKRGENEFIKTVYGRGYRFVRPVRPVRQPEPTLMLPRAQPAPPFVGREQVLEQLQRALREAEQGRGRMCALLGEPGIGKSFAVEAFARGLSGGTRVVWGFCRESGDAPPLWPWLRLLRELLASPAADEAPPEPALVALLRDTGVVEAGRGAAAEQAWFQRHQQLLAYQAVSRLLSQRAQRAPLLLVLEDLHAADAATLELLLHLLDEIAAQRILLLVTLRHSHVPEREVVRARLRAALGHAQCEHVTLARLPESAVRAYVLATLGTTEEPLTAAIIQKSDGHPFYMAELCRQLRDGSPRERQALSMSAAALDLVRQHVARLDAEALGVLSAAAVIGRSFELSLLRAVTNGELGALTASLDAARAAEVVVATSDSPTVFAFGHELFRAALYEALAPAVRRGWHVRVADALDRRARAGEPVVASEVAYHLYAALPVSDPEKTVHYCRLAADVAAAAFANDEVVRHMHHALAALDLTPAPDVGLRMQLVQLIAIYARGASAAEYVAAARELARLARKTRNPAMLVRAGLMFNLHPGFKQLPGVGDELAYALRLLAPEESGLRAAALSGLAVSSPTCFSAARAEPLLQEAVPLARSAGSPPALYAALICALQLRGGPAEPDQASAVLAELDRLAYQHPTRMPVLPIDLALYRCVSALQRGDATAAGQSAQGAGVHARRLHHDELAWHAERFRALIALERDPSEGAQRQLVALHQRARDPGLFGLSAFCAFDQVLWLTELDPALRLDPESLEALAYDSADPPSLWSLKLRALASADPSEDARTALHAVAASDLAGLPSDRDLLGTLGHVARAALLLGDRVYAEHAAACLARYRDAYAVHIGCVWEGSVPHLLGVVARALGDCERAVHELEQGIERDLQAGLVRCAGYARLELARALFEAGRAERAQKLGLEVSRDAGRLGLQRLQRAAEAWLAQADPRAEATR